MHPSVFLAAAGPTLHFDLDFFLDFVFHPSSALIGGLAITIYASVIAQTVGVILGTLSALAGMARNPVLRAISGIYVWFFRGTPLLVQMFLVYFGTPYLLGVDLFPRELNFDPVSLRGAVVAGIVALAINEGAYMSEIVRAGILSVDTGQAEAAKSLGMTYGLTMRRIVLPQALRVIVPPLGNEFNNMLKTTSLMSVIAVEELFRVAQAANSATFKSFEAFLGIALYYLALTTIWSILQGAVERRLGEGTAASADTRVGLVARLLGLARPNSAGLGR
ncbi:MAG TPA: amino acid ABC transporter permease [Candidatus Limnocylindrales bacterium]|nr:amino acid ABC transporter permease [Candidatus Limnocylindrales bacterium]